MRNKRNKINMLKKIANRYFPIIINNLCVIYYKHLCQKGKFNFMLETTNLCNAKCDFCPNSTLKREKRTMDNEMFSLIIKRMKAEDIRPRNIFLHINGEPLIDKGLAERIRLLKKEFPKCKVHFTSNFTLADKETILSILNSGLDSLTISLNAVEAKEYSKIMGNHLKYENTYKNLDNAIKLNNSNGQKVKIILSIVETPDNTNSVKKFVDKWSSVAETKVMKVGEWTNSNKKSNRKSIVRLICPRIFNTICILSNGDFSLCCFDAEGMIGVNIKDTEIKKAFSNLTFNKIRMQQIKSGRSAAFCQNCSMNEIYQ